MASNIFSFLSYYTVYSAEEGDRCIRALASSVCFAAVFPSLAKDRHYHIRVYKGVFQAKERNKSNNCIIHPDMISSFIGECKKLFPFTYSIEDNKDFYLVNVNIKGPALYHRFILTWVRYLYEYPYNVLVLDVYRLKKIPEYQHLNIFNLMNVVLFCSGLASPGHSIIPGDRNATGFVTIKQLRRRMEDMVQSNDFRLSDIYSSYYPLRSSEFVYQSAFSQSIRTLEFWQSGKAFLERLNFYKAYINFNKNK